MFKALSCWLSKCVEFKNLLTIRSTRLSVGYINHKLRTSKTWCSLTVDGQFRTISVRATNSDDCTAIEREIANKHSIRRANAKTTIHRGGRTAVLSSGPVAGRTPPTPFRSFQMAERIQLVKNVRYPYLNAKNKDSSHRVTSFPSSRSNALISSKQHRTSLPKHPPAHRFEDRYTFQVHCCVQWLLSQPRMGPSYNR